VARHWSPDPTFTVLFVCTGNICRSALAERLSRAYLDDALGENAALVRVHSAGVQAVVGSGVHPDSARVLAGLGGDPAGFAARQLVDDMAVDADLTLTMTRSHRRAVLKAAPRALSRTFTLREAADLVALLGDHASPAGESFADRARDLVKQLAAARSRRSSDAADDVPDPIGEPLEVHQQVGELIAEALVPLFSRFVALRVPEATTEESADDGPDEAPPRLHLVS
jgi:protein-tyrosine phosphatase